MAQYKFGTLASDGSDVPFYYDDVYEVQETTGQPRLVIAPRHGHLELMAELVEALEPPFYLLYVLLVGRTGREEGRYQSPNAYEANGVREFLSCGRVILRLPVLNAGSVFKRSMISAFASPVLRCSAAATSSFGVALQTAPRARKPDGVVNRRVLSLRRTQNVSLACSSWIS
jgi:hypothetical protein